jgi:Xaa-Pro aminopeptidase
VTPEQGLASDLRRYLMADPVSHEKGASRDRMFRVDMLAVTLGVEADVIRMWALDVGPPNEKQVATINAVLHAAQDEH